MDLYAYFPYGRSMKPDGKSSLLDRFAKNLRRIREERGYSQDELAERAGLDRTYISGCERAKRNATLRSIEKLANALSVDGKDLIK